MLMLVCSISLSGYKRLVLPSQRKLEGEMLGSKYWRQDEWRP